MLGDESAEGYAIGARKKQISRAVSVILRFSAPMQEITWLLDNHLQIRWRIGSRYGCPRVELVGANVHA
jgi:hypothetical protein